MSSQDNERRVLDAIENQLRTEDPGLTTCFLAFSSITRPFKPVKASDRPAPHREVAPRQGVAPRHAHPRTDRQVSAIVTQLVLLISACTLLAALLAALVWLVFMFAQ